MLDQRAGTVHPQSAPANSGTKQLAEARLIGSHREAIPRSDVSEVDWAQHADLRYAEALMTDLPATDAALNRGYLSAKLHADLAAHGGACQGSAGAAIGKQAEVARFIPAKKSMLNPPPWNKAIYARRHRIENTFSRLKDYARVALRCDKTQRSWMGFVHLAAIMINLHVAKFNHRS